MLNFSQVESMLKSTFVEVHQNANKLLHVYGNCELSVGSKLVQVSLWDANKTCGLCSSAGESDDDPLTYELYFVNALKRSFGLLERLFSDAPAKPLRAGEKTLLWSILAQWTHLFQEGQLFHRESNTYATPEWRSVFEEFATTSLSAVRSELTKPARQKDEYWAFIPEDFICETLLDLNGFHGVNLASNYLRASKDGWLLISAPANALKDCWLNEKGTTKLESPLSSTAAYTALTLALDGMAHSDALTTAQTLDN